jgi:4-amino-4-deoxy-L-arabinose transferase-like glycosyltransferase
MQAATLTRPEPAYTTIRPSRRPRGEPPAPSGKRRDLIPVALGGLLVTTFLLRLWGVKQGLPYTYNVDEEAHFVPRAISFFSHDLNPHYFLNPPAFSYVLHGVFDVWFGGSDGVTRAYASNPSEVFIVARVVAAAMGTLAVWLTYLAGKRLFSRPAGLFAAAIFGLAFLPVFYSHLALNDVPTLAPVALSLYGVGGVLRRGRLSDYVVAGLGIGLASATKYTGGVTLLCLLGAAVCDAAGGSRGTTIRRLAVGLVVALAAFVIANPYSVLDFSAFWDGVASQASRAAGQDPVKLGTTAGSGITYYLWAFTWGLGWAPTIAALGGTALLFARRRLAMALVLLPAPIIFIIFMGTQQRFFGRWLMPIFPIVVLLAGYFAVEVGRWLIRARRVPAVVVWGVLAAVLLSQSVASVLHDDAVLSRPDTRNLTRAWLVNNVPAGAKVVVEPFVPSDWATDVGTSLAWTPTGERWWRYPTWLTNVDEHLQPLPAGDRRFVLVDQYERTLRPELIDEYVRDGYCWVVVGSLQAGRAFAQPHEAPGAIAYYAALAQRGRRVYHVSPFRAGVQSVPFSFDWSIDYYPRQYEQPGAEMSVFRLTEGKCAS